MANKVASAMCRDSPFSLFSVAVMSQCNGQQGMGNIGALCVQALYVPAKASIYA